MCGIAAIAVAKCTDHQTAWKLHYSGRGKGNFEGDRAPNNPIDMQQYYYLLQKRKTGGFLG